MIDYRRPKDEVAADDPSRTTAICPRCEGPATTSIEDDTVEFGDREIAITMPVRACSDCDIQFVDRVGARVETEAIYRYHGLLTPWQIRTIRERRKLSRTAFAQITGLGEATIKRWETGAVAQNRANDHYLRLLATPQCWAELQRITSGEGQSSSAAEAPLASVLPLRRLKSTTELNQRKEDFSLAQAV